MRVDWSKKSNAGFSLVEALLATFILATVSLAATAIVMSFFSGSDRQARQAGLIDGLLVFQNTLKEDLGHSLKRPGGFPELSSSFVSTQGERCFLSFMRGGAMAAQVDEAAVDIEPVRYCFEGNSIYREAGIRPDMLNNTPSRRYLLIRNIDGMTASYFDGQSWFDSWADGDEHFVSDPVSEHPLLVRIELTHKRGSEGQKRVTTRHLFRTGAGQ